MPYQRSEKTPNLGVNDSSDDIRGGMGYEGLLELWKFVKEGGTLIVEGATTNIFPEYNLTTGITIEEPAGLFARGSVMRGVFSDRTSPISYGYNEQVPVYFNQAPVLSVAGGGGGFGGFGGAGASRTQQNTTPMATRVTTSAWDWNVAEGTTAPADAAATPAAPAARGGRGAAPNAPAAAGAARTGPATPAAPARRNDSPRVILSFPTNVNDILLSGTLDNGAALAGKAQVVDAPIGEGHVVMFAIRPFWRWQTHGTFFLGFNTILHWNDLSAGR